MTAPKLVYQYRGVLVSLPLVFAAVCFYHEVEDYWLIWPLGVTTFVFGLLLRIWARQHCTYRQEITKHLAASGPYLLVRNPLYIGNTLMCLGAVVLSELLWLVPITLLNCVLVYALTVRHEEERLSLRYGEAYRRYMLEVPRWFPRFMHLKNIELNKGFLWKSVVTEIPCLLILFPYIIKEVVERWVEH